MSIRNLYNNLLKRMRKGSIGVFGPMITGILIGTATPVILIISYLILANTGIWWIPLIICFLTALSFPVSMYVDRRKRNEYHMHVGHEMYYSEYPDDLEKDLKKARKAGIPENVQKVAEYYRARPCKGMKFTEKREKKRRTMAGLFNVGVAVTALVGIFVLLRAFPFPEGFFQQELITADVTPIFLIFAGVLTVISAVTMLYRKSYKSYRYVAAIMMGLSVWSALTAYTLDKRPTYMDSVVNGVCLLVFLVAAFAIPVIAGDIRTAEQLSRDEKELKISLFEMGYINEEELKRL